MYPTVTTSGGNNAPLPNTQSYYTSSGQSVIYDPITKSFGAPVPISNTPAVVSSNAAKINYGNQLNDFNSIVNGVTQQSALVKQNQLIANQVAAENARIANEDALKNRELDIQQQSANAKTAAAAQLSGGPSTTQGGVNASSIPTYNTIPSGQYVAPAPTTNQTPNGSVPNPGNLTTGTSNSSLFPSLANYSDAQQAIQGQRQNLFDQMSAQLSQVTNGTFPLSATEQALVDSTQQSFNQAKQDQELANQSYIGSLETAGARAGRSEYTPEIQGGILHNAISAGIAKVNEIDRKATQALAELKLQFQDKNYKLINDQYSRLDNLLAQKSQAIADIQKQATDYAKTVQDYNLSIAKFQEQIKQDEIDNKFKQQQLSISNAELALKQGEFNMTYGSFFNPSTGNTTSVSEIPGVKTMVNGGYYLDPSTISNPKQKMAAENIARNAGIAVVNPTDGATLTKIDTALSRLNTMSDYVGQIAPANRLAAKPLAKLAYAAGNAVNALGYTTDIQAARDAYNSNKLEVFNIINAMSGSNPRINGSTLLAAYNSLPSFDVLNTSNIKEANAKLDLMRNYLTDAVHSIIPNYVAPLMGRQFNSLDEAYSYAKNMHKDSEIKSIISNNPGLTADEVLSVINGMSAK